MATGSPASSQEPAARRHSSGSVAGADVLEVGEPVEELAADEVQVAVAVEVGEVRRGHAERCRSGRRRPRSCAGGSYVGLIVRAVVADQVDPAVQRAAGPVSRASKALSQP